MSQENRKKRGGRPSANQKLVVAQFMRDHPHFAAGRFQGADGKGTASRLWVDLAKRANGEGEKKRSAVQWKKTWLDMKGRARTNAAAVIVARNRTGNRLDNLEPLNAIDKLVIDIMGKVVVVGLPGVRQMLPRAKVDMDRLMADSSDEMFDADEQENEVDYLQKKSNVLEADLSNGDETFNCMYSDLDGNTLSTQTDRRILTTQSKTQTPQRSSVPTSILLSPAPIPSTSTFLLSTFTSIPSTCTHLPSTSTQIEQTPATTKPSMSIKRTVTVTSSSSSTSLPSEKSPPKKCVKRKQLLKRVSSSKSDNRAAQFLEVQEKQNQNLETLGQAMLQAAQNGAEANRIRRLAAENTARLYDRLGELIAVLKYGFDQKKEK